MQAGRMIDAPREAFMPTHTTRLAPAPAMFAIVIAAVALTLPSSHAAPAAKDCLATPNTPAPQGSHWYYRADRDKRGRSWYLAPKGQAVRRVSSRKSLLSTAPVPRPRPVAEAPAQPPSAVSGAEATVGSGAWSPSPEQPRAYRAQSDQGPPAGAIEREPVLALNPDERSSTDTQDEMPLIWPVLTATELAAAERVPVSAVTPERIFLLLAGALAFTAIGCHAILRFSDTLLVRPDRPERRAKPWNGALPGKLSPPPRSGARPIRDHADDIREPHPPRDRSRDIEAALQQILQRWERRAAEAKRPAS
jgi:hypothetical protein